MTDINSENGHINPLELDDETISTEATLEWAEWATSSTEEAANKPKANNFKKILSEKNAALNKVKELESKLANSEFWEEKVEAMIQSAMANARASTIKNTEREAFVMNYWDAKVEAIEAVLEQHPSLSYEQAARMEWLETPKNSNPNRLSFSGNTPASLKQSKTVNDLNDADLKSAMTEELKWLGFGR